MKHKPPRWTREQFNADRDRAMTRNLEQAQENGLTIFWAHDLDAMIDFINATQP